MCLAFFIFMNGKQLIQVYFVQVCVLEGLHFYSWQHITLAALLLKMYSARREVNTKFEDICSNFAKNFCLSMGENVEREQNFSLDEARSGQ